MIARDCDEGTALLKRDARRLITQLVSGEASGADFDAAKRWRRQSPAHETAFVEAMRLWQNLGTAGRDLLAQEGAPAWPSPAVSVSRRTILIGGGALAAAAAAYAVVNPPLGLWPSFDELRADYRTVTGEQRDLTLADNVSVRMNTQSAMAVPPPGDGRDEVTLISGEASFAMLQQSTRSLAVVTNAGLTVANRARFDVRNFGSGVCVTCFDGDVRVEQGAQTATVGINEQIRYDKNGIGKTVSINPVETAAWREGVLIFRDTPLADVITELNRYRPGKIVLAKTGLAQKAVNGRFRIDRIDDVIAWLAQVYGAIPRSLPGRVTLLT
jgi:transmembrane sensor